MSIQRYPVNHHPIQTLLTWISFGEIAMPEIQQPFVWSATKVLDIIDSLNAGYPIVNLIAWRNPFLHTSVTSVFKFFLMGEYGFK